MPTYTRSGAQCVRLTVSDKAEGLSISTTPPRDWSALFVALWLGFWTFAGLHSWRNRINHFGLFSVVWALGELWGSYFILDNFGGSEQILARPEALTRAKKIFGLGWSKTYPVQEIRNLRFQRGLGRRPSRIAFDYGARTIRFGAGIDEAEACAVMNRIRQRCLIADD